MKYIAQQCFRSAYDLYLWQSANCAQCKKAVYYNTKLGRMPQYRCAVQQQIEIQQVAGNDGEYIVTQRTFEAVQGERCKYFVPKVEAVEQPKILDFSKGESIYQEPPKEEPKQDAPQPAVEELKPLSYDAALMQMSIDTGISYDDLREAEKRMFNTIAKNGHFPPATADFFRQRIKDDTRKMLDTFTWDENMMIAFVPLIISKIAWVYAEQVAKYCADKRIQAVKKLTRTLKDVRQRYIDDLRQDLDAEHINSVETQALQFYDECAYDFKVLWLQVNQAIKREYPEIDHEEMRTDAVCGLTMVDFLVRHNRDMDKIIAKKMGASNSIIHPKMKALRSLLDAFLPTGFKLQDTRQIDLCVRILAKRIREIKFQVVDNTAEAG